ncbi:hypothetical protein P3342_000354 [Pyrenophora teres f. teres]|nr:hypothetical protein P3342_000354 [Pyrenophora teres f. teres]
MVAKSSKGLGLGLLGVPLGAGRSCHVWVNGWNGLEGCVVWKKDLIREIGLRDIGRRVIAVGAMCGRYQGSMDEWWARLVSFLGEFFCRIVAAAVYDTCFIPEGLRALCVVLEISLYEYYWIQDQDIQLLSSKS